MKKIATLISRKTVSLLVIMAAFAAMTFSMSSCTKTAADNPTPDKPKNSNDLVIPPSIYSATLKVYNGTAWVDGKTCPETKFTFQPFNGPKSGEYELDEQCKANPIDAEGNYSVSGNQVTLSSGVDSTAASLKATIVITGAHTLTLTADKLQYTLTDDLNH